MDDRQPLSRNQVEGFAKSLSNWGRFGDDDQLGTLNLIGPEQRAAAAALVRSGRAVSCARPLPTAAAPDNPVPVVHLMTGTGPDACGDYFAIAPHGYATSHIDALCHVFAGEQLYNGYPADRIGARGALELGIDALRDGIVTRGVLLDIPALKGVPYLEAGTPIFPDELEAAETEAGLRVESGDVLFVRTGRWRERDERGAWDPHDRLAGLDASCLPWLHARGVAALGGDGVSDVTPSRIDGVRLPIHAIAIPVIGLHLIDNLDFERLAAACVAEGRWAFMLTIAPLVLERGTASPVNPIALF